MLAIELSSGVDAADPVDAARPRPRHCRGGPRRRRRPGPRAAAPASAVTVGVTALSGQSRVVAAYAPTSPADDQRRDDDAGAQRRAPRRIRRAGRSRPGRTASRRSTGPSTGPAERAHGLASSTHARARLGVRGACRGRRLGRRGGRSSRSGRMPPPARGSERLSVRVDAADGIHRLFDPRSDASRAASAQAASSRVHPLKVHRRRRAILIGTTTGVR